MIMDAVDVRYRCIFNGAFHMEMDWIEKRELDIVSLIHENHSDWVIACNNEE